MATASEIVIDTRRLPVALITLNRPQARNALTTALLGDIATALDGWRDDPEVRVVVISGGDTVFAAGADLKEMQALDMVGILKDPRQQFWRRIADFNKSVIAAVNGYALGAGCELAMHADIIIAGKTAQFGQPEINLGIIPGAGGTQRLIRAVGKSLAMKLVLSGELIGAAEAKTAGLVAEVTEPEATLERALALAATIATKAPLAVEQAKDVMLKAFDTHLEQGLLYERKAFTVLAATADRNEGIQAFFDKRAPVFKGA